MLSRLLKSLEDRERSWRESFGNDISTPAKRRQARWHFNWVDHGILRHWWTNFDQVAPGVYRSNQPSPERLVRYRDLGIRSVLNLRGTSLYSYYLFEAEACEALGLSLTDINLFPTALPTAEAIFQLEDHFRNLEKPFIMHCKSGADRAGFASALYLLLIEGATIEQAMRQMSFRYLHIRASAKGILDYFLESYGETNKAQPIAFREWVITMYDRDALTEAFHTSRSRGKGKP